MEDEYDLLIKHNRINIIKDLNEFGRKGKRHRSLDGRKKKKGYEHGAISKNFKWDSDVSETEEEDWISDDSTKEKGKSLSKFSRIFNKIYADHFERPIRIKQIKEKSRRNIHNLGDTPINEDSNDGSNKSINEDISDTSSSNVSFRRIHIKTLFDKLDMPEHKLLRQPTETMVSRLDRWKMFDIAQSKKVTPSKKKQKSFKLTSSSLNNEPILEENDEDNDAIDPDYHHFALKSQNSFKLA